MNLVTRQRRQQRFHFRPILLESLAPLLLDHRRNPEAGDFMGHSEVGQPQISVALVEVAKVVVENVDCAVASRRPIGAIGPVAKELFELYAAAN